ncbi:AraC family transcriptional regulator [Roseibium sp. SCPC15]|uniref:AraC family transcriptional regulator n=1 Tax=Roseibium sp. SCP15 TaxID=3141376 RepID=UPI0033371BA5
MVVHAASRSPLNQFSRFETADVDEAREIVARHFCSHRLERMSSSDRFDARQNRVDGCRVSLNYIRYGADVTIDPGELSEFFLVQIPIVGSAQIENGCRSVFSTPKMGAILNPDRHTSMRWHAGCEQMLLQIEQSYMQEIAARMAGRPIGKVRFRPDFNLEKSEGEGWTQALRGVFRAAEEGSSFRTLDQRQQYLEEGLVMSLLNSQPNTISPMLERCDGGAAPAILKRALSLIHERLDEDIGLFEICGHAGTTPRNLQLVFKKELGCSPIQYLQSARMKFARHLLLSDAGNHSIAEIADRSGHRHFGRFSVAYKKQFGETPRDTMRHRIFG